MWWEFDAGELAGMWQGEGRSFVFTTASEKKPPLTSSGVVRLPDPLGPPRGSTNGRS